MDLRWDNRSIEGSTNYITFDNCVLWTDLAQSMEVGFECVGVTMNNIVFQNITGHTFIVDDVSGYGTT